MTLDSISNAQIRMLPSTTIDDPCANATTSVADSVATASAEATFVDNNRTHIIPKKPLSPYNLFFQLERQRILQHGMDQFDSTGLMITQETMRKANEAHLQRRGKRAHRRSHGKIGFHDLAQIVAARWKQLDEEARDRLRHFAKAEKAKYLKELQVWEARNKNKTKTMHEHAREDPPANNNSMDSKKRKEATSLHAGNHNRDAEYPVLSNKKQKRNPVLSHKKNAERTEHGKEKKKDAVALDVPDSSTTENAHHAAVSLLQPCPSSIHLSSSLELTAARYASGGGTMATTSLVLTNETSLLEDPRHQQVVTPVQSLSSPFLPTTTNHGSSTGNSSSMRGEDTMKSRIHHDDDIPKEVTIVQHSFPMMTQILSNAGAVNTPHQHATTWRSSSNTTMAMPTVTLSSNTTDKAPFSHFIGGTDDHNDQTWSSCLFQWYRHSPIFLNAAVEHGIDLSAPMMNPQEMEDLFGDC